MSGETAAIVLDCRDHGESDKIITFFTPDEGRLTGIAKGANRSKKRFLNKLELFSYLTISYSERQRSSLAFIADAELNESFINLRNDIDRYTAATFIREVLLIAIVEKQGDKDIFNLLLWALQSLDEKKSHLGITATFLIRLYDLLGYCPDLFCCRVCGCLFSLDQRYSFHHSTGGLICQDCMGLATDNISNLSMGSIRMLQSALSEPLERLNRLHFSSHVLQQSLTMLHRYGRTLFQREIQSWKALQKTLPKKNRQQNTK